MVTEGVGEAVEVDFELCHVEEVSQQI